MRAGKGHLYNNTAEADLPLQRETESEIQHETKEL